MADIFPSTLPQALVWLSTTSIVVIGVSGIIRFRQLPGSLRYLAALSIFILPLEILGIALMVMQRSNLFLMPIYTIGELGLLFLLYQRVLGSGAFSRWAPWLAGGFTLYTILDSLLGPGLKWFRPGQQIAESLLILLVVWLYFQKLLSELRVRRLTREPMFWVSTGLLVYFLGYLQIALFSNYLLRHYSLQFNRNVWAVHTLLSIVLHSCYCVALWMRPQK